MIDRQVPKAAFTEAVLAPVFFISKKTGDGQDEAALQDITMYDYQK